MFVKMSNKIDCSNFWAYAEFRAWLTIIRLIIERKEYQGFSFGGRNSNSYLFNLFKFFF